MNKSPEAFRTISEVADALDVPPHVLRFWETRFTQVKPVKRGGGRRYYRPEDVRLLRGIRGLLYDDGMTIKGVQKILREKGVRHVIGLGTPAGSEPDATPEVAPETARETGRETAPAPSPETAASPPVPKPAAAGSGRPQGDLFGAPGGAVMTAPPAAQAETAGETTEETEPAAAPATRDGRSLKSLVAELEALRAVMIADPER